MTEIPAIIIAALLGALQGFTEFLPISSSAHLYAVPYLFSLNDPLLDSLAFAAVLHLGTLAAVLVAMRHEVVRLTGVVLRFIFSLGRTRGEASDERLIVAIILGTIPAAIAGALASDLIDGALRSPMIVAAAVLAGAALLGVAERFGRRERPLEGIAIFDVHLDCG
jgi:undecaprenyl-diphosphatase